LTESNVLIEKLEKLPLDKQREVEDFVDFLLAKQTPGIQLTGNEVAEPTESYARGFGSLKVRFSRLTILMNHLKTLMNTCDASILRHACASLIFKF